MKPWVSPCTGKWVRHTKLFLALIAPLLAGCSMDQAALQTELQTVTTKYERLEKAHRKLQDAMSARNGSSPAKNQLLMLEKEALIKDLGHRLEDAIQEVVRAKAKLRSLESKAEAASTLAEAEIALKSLKSSDDRDKDPGLHEAEDLLKMATAEFKKENYGGALYLSGQAKTQIKEGEELHRGREKTAPVAGEVAFALPLPLRLTEGAKLRSGPGQEFNVVMELSRAAPVLGVSHKGDWVRVKAEDGRSGWVSYTQVQGR
jgi:hypothetical protein